MYTGPEGAASLFTLGVSLEVRQTNILLLYALPLVSSFCVFSVSFCIGTCVHGTHSAAASTTLSTPGRYVFQSLVA